MSENQDHMFTVIDFIKIGSQTCHVQVAGFDATANQAFKGEVRFLGNEPFGDFIHPERSPLSPACRQFVQTKLINKYEAGEFN